MEDQDDDTSFDAYDYLEQYQIEEPHELNNCLLSEEELQELLDGCDDDPAWRDLVQTENPTIILMDSSKEFQWELAQRELDHLRESLRNLMSLDPNQSITPHAIAMLCLGPDSKTGRFLCDEIGLVPEKYLEFMGTLTVQAAYGVSVTELFHERLSLLKTFTLMEEKEYVDIWKKIATKRQLDDSEISTNRREVPLWETMETIVNEFLKSISITERKGKISVALDDDKIWANLKNSSKDDLFNLKYTTHVKDNRKGFVAHTAVSSGANIPLGISFERIKDTTEKCFKRLLESLFGQDGNTDLRNVLIHSDRGYLLPSLVFKFLIQAGAEVLGTVKRIAGWPFTFDQKLKPSDKRTLVSKKGAATLFMKWCATGTKAIFASAFRNGTDRVATAISTVHTQHHWEAIILKPAELREYKNDPTSLQKKFFEFVSLRDAIENEEDSVRLVMDEILEDRIDPITLRQGMLLWYF